MKIITTETLKNIENQIWTDMFFSLMDILFLLKIELIYNYFYPSIHSNRSKYIIYKSSNHPMLLYKIYVFLRGYAARRIEMLLSDCFIKEKDISENISAERKEDMFNILFLLKI
jgi:hypothetical protein